MTSHPVSGTIKVLAFDVFGTVVDWRNGLARAAAEAFGAIGRTDIDAFRFADDWHHAAQPKMDECRQGVRPYTQLDTLHREVLTALLGDCGVRAADLPDGGERLATAWRRLDPWPDVLPALGRLREHLALVTLSNGNIALTMEMARFARLPWDAILGAEVAQVYKPLPGAYRNALDVLGIEPGELCMVAAHEGDLAAAQQLGISTAYVDRPTEFGETVPGSLAGKPWNFVCRDYVEFCDQLLLR